MPVNVWKQNIGGLRWLQFFLVQVDTHKRNTDRKQNNKRRTSEMWFTHPKDKIIIHQKMIKETSQRTNSQSIWLWFFGNGTQCGNHAPFFQQQGLFQQIMLSWSLERRCWIQQGPWDCIVCGNKIVCGVGAQWCGLRRPAGQVLVPHRREKRKRRSSIPSAEIKSIIGFTFYTASFLQQYWKMNGRVWRFFFTNVGWFKLDLDGAHYIDHVLFDHFHPVWRSSGTIATRRPKCVKWSMLFECVCFLYVIHFASFYIYFNCAVVWRWFCDGVVHVWCPLVFPMFVVQRCETTIANEDRLGHPRGPIAFWSRNHRWTGDMFIMCLCAMQWGCRRHSRPRLTQRDVAWRSVWDFCPWGLNFESLDWDTGKFSGWSDTVLFSGQEVLPKFLCIWNSKPPARVAL